MTPEQVGSGYIAVAVAGNDMVALKSDGSLWVWGAGGLSPLNAGPTGSGYIAVAVGAALKSDGTLWTWGSNNFGALGIGNDTSVYWAWTPIQIGSGYSAIVVGGGGSGGDFKAALKPDGSLWTWGLNSSGQLGYATPTTTCLVNPGLANQMNIPCSRTPVQVGSGYRVDQ